MRRLKYLLLVPIMCISAGVMAQETKADSLQRTNSEYLADLRSKMITTEAIAKEANAAATESKRAYRSEQKAQNARKKADKHARKARKARVDAQS